MRSLLRSSIFFISINIIAINTFAQGGSNDHIFPAAYNAKPFIDFDSKGFLINGKRTFIVSAGMEYARVPRQLWFDRLLRLKRAGFNCIEIYTFWNFHEQQEGEFNFSGDHDLDYFLKLVAKMGMYAIVRVGPYYCAEWDNGGYPLWLRFKPGLRVREHNTEFEKYTDRFFDMLLPIICSNQINHGGAVVMVQLENEHTEGWGTFMPNEYFHHLREKALSLGLEVPYFFSGLHHSSDPAGDGKLDDSLRPNPWFSTEFWSVWYTGYSSTVADAQVYERKTWRIIANGGNGYNYYMAHGGSNFNYTNNDEDAASYDYGAAVGQAGDLRPIYYSFKRMAFFARSFQDVLENSTNATDGYKNFLSDTVIHATIRKSPAGDIIFLDNPSSTSITTQIHTRDRIPFPASVTLKAGEIFPVVHHFKINNSVTLEWAPVKILGISRQENTTTIVIYGEPGSPAKLVFSLTGTPSLKPADPSLTLSAKRVYLHASISDKNKPELYSFTVGTQKIRILAMNERVADRTWFIEVAKHPYIVCGPDYIGEANINNGHISILTERPLDQNEIFPAWIYSEQGEKKLPVQKHFEIRQKTQLTPTVWQMKKASEESEAGYDDHNWKASALPLQMGADGDTTADAWYRTKINIDSPGTYTLQVDGSDRATGFIDGKVAGTGDIKQGEITFDLTKGTHTLALFTAHDGRDKMAGFMGDMDSVDRKGIFGKAVLIKGGPSMYELDNWRFLKVSDPDALNKGVPSPSIGGWTNYTIGKDVFDGKQGFGWFQTVLLGAPAGIEQAIISFKSVDENATVFVNENKIVSHKGWNIPFSAVIEHIDTFRKPVMLTVFIENYSNEGGIDKHVRLNYMPVSYPQEGWCMRGGFEDPKKINDWRVSKENISQGGPCFFRTQFELPSEPAAGDHFIWRVNTQGLGHGSIWVNGHNLGRYPEKIPINGLYIPECWIRTGQNLLIIYDEDGRFPNHVSIEAEMAASREVEVLKY